MQDNRPALPPLDGQNEHQPLVPPLERGFDFVFVVDGAGAEENLLEAAKSKALDLHRYIQEYLQGRNSLLKSLRVRLIVFRGQKAKEGPRVESRDFFNLPEEADAFRQYADSLRSAAGADDPRGGMEALMMAIKSDWLKASMKMRHFIIVMAGRSTHPSDILYPFDEPGFTGDDGLDPLDFLQLNWINPQGSLSKDAKRMILLTPDTYPWSKISWWDYTTFDFSRLGTQESENNYNIILKSFFGAI